MLRLVTWTTASSKCGAIPLSEVETPLGAEAATGGAEANVAFGAVVGATFVDAVLGRTEAAAFGVVCWPFLVLALPLFSGEL